MRIFLDGAGRGPAPAPSRPPYHTKRDACSTRLPRSRWLSSRPIDLTHHHLRVLLAAHNKPNQALAASAAWCCAPRSAARMSTWWPSTVRVCCEQHQRSATGLRVADGQRGFRGAGRPCHRRRRLDGLLLSSFHLLLTAHPDPFIGAEYAAYMFKVWANVGCVCVWPHGALCCPEGRPPRLHCLTHAPRPSPSSP